MLRPAHYYRKAFTNKSHIGAALDGYAIVLCHWDFNMKDAIVEESPSNRCLVCEASWNKITDYSRHSPAHLKPPAGKFRLFTSIETKVVEG